MTALSPMFQTIATTCGLCHDQCVSACPVVDSSQTLLAYPSRLASLAWELSRGSLAPGADSWQALAHCIHCNACTENCVYIDQHMDVTPLVRWARQSLVEQGQTSPQLSGLIEKINRLGSPFGNVSPMLEELSDIFPRSHQPGGTLVIADASQLALDLPSAEAGLRLLDRLGYPNINLSALTYTGWELWQYGCRDAVQEIAQAWAREVERIQPEMIVTLTPSSAYLLRHVFPQELGTAGSIPVMTLPEAVQARIGSLSPRPVIASEPVFLVPSYTEINQMRSFAAREVLERTGISLVDFPDRQPFRPAAYPEGVCIDLDPDPGIQIAHRIARMVESSPDCRVVCTTAFAKLALQAALPGIPVSDWSSYLLDQ